jgi:hypothetical protein
MIIAMAIEDIFIHVCVCVYIYIYIFIHKSVKRRRIVQCFDDDGDDD